MLRKLIVFALMCCVAMPTLAQMEFHVDVVDTFEAAETGFYGIREEYKTTADYMFLTNREGEFCSGNMMFSDNQIYDVQLCVFEDPVSNELFLYATGECCFPHYTLFYEGEILGRLTQGTGISHPPPGEYDTHISFTKRSGNERISISAKLSFTLYPTTQAGEVEFRKTPLNVDDFNSSDDLDTDQETIAKHLYRVHRNQYCTADLTPENDPSIVICLADCDREIRICVFENDETRAPFLYTSSRTIADFIIYHDSAFVGYPRSRGVSTLEPGEYKVLIVSRFHDFFSYYPIKRFGIVSFTVLEPTKETD